MVKKWFTNQNPLNQLMICKHIKNNSKKQNNYKKLNYLLYNLK